MSHDLAVFSTQPTTNTERTHITMTTTAGHLALIVKGLYEVTRDIGESFGTIQVAAGSFDAAINLVKAQWPETNITSVHRVGSVHIER
jgi:hypothetical protein